ncbi:MAG: hypothetical protein ACETVX_03595, partial [bacterium]
MKRVILMAGLALLIIINMQCKEKQDIEKDKDAVRQAVLNDDNWFGCSTTTDSTIDTSEVKFGTDTLLGWWRGVQTHSEPTVDVQVVGDSAYVDWSRHNYGDLNLLIKVPDTSWQLWVKKVYETASVRGIFRRTGDTNDSLRGWRLQKISLATGISDSITQVKIDSLRIQSQSIPDMVIKDPLNSFYRIDSLPSFRSAEQVTITLYTNATEGKAFLHTFIFAIIPYVRLPFNYIGNGVYTGTWNTQIVKFPRFAIFDHINYKTLFTPPDVYGYDFCGWL